MSRRDAVESYVHEGQKITIYPDEMTENPRHENDNAGTICIWHRRYSFGDKDAPKDWEELIVALAAAVEDDDKRDEILESDCTNGEKLQKIMEAAPKIILMPIYMYDHSGVSISVSNGYPYNDRWDGGQCGFIYMLPKTIEEEWGGDRKKAENCCKAEVKELDQYLRGDVYGWVVNEDEGTEESCWGFYGLDYCKKEAQSMAEHIAKSKSAKPSGGTSKLERG